MTDLQVDFHLMSRRYRCRSCAGAYERAKRAAEAEAARLGLQVKRCDINAGNYTFMAWHPDSVSKLSHGRSSSFPAHLTARGGVSILILDMMRPLFNSGVKPETFAKLVLELQTKTHARRHLEYEHGLTVMRSSPNFPPRAALELFSCFGDRSKYAGVVPTGQYFESVYVNYHDTISEHLDTEVCRPLA